VLLFFEGDRRISSFDHDFLKFWQLGFDEVRDSLQKIHLRRSNLTDNIVRRGISIRIGDGWN
jgi:hypothetical protein